MLKPLSYILDDELNFWLVSFYQGKQLYGKKIYVPDQSGNRYHPILNKKYKKEISEYLPIPDSYIEEFHPDTFFKNKKNELTDVWKKYVEALNIVGIKDENIGIFGSVLIGFPIEKDIDFIIYEKENLKIYAQSIDFIKKYTNTTNISEEHIEYQLKKYGHKYNENTDFKKILMRNWSGIQLENGVLSTPRFLIEGMFDIPKRDGENRLISCKVLSGLTSSCMPRFVPVLYKNQIYQLITPFWMFQSFAHDGDQLIIHGNVDDNNKTILLSNKNDYLKFVN